MASRIIIYTTYDYGNDFGGALEVTKFSVQKRGVKTSENKWKMSVNFESGVGSVSTERKLKKARILIDPELAIPLARNLLSVAEGYVTQSESEVA